MNHLESTIQMQKSLGKCCGSIEEEMIVAGYKAAIEALRSSNAQSYSFAKWNEQFQDDDGPHADAMLTRFDWAQWLESKLPKPNQTIGVNENDVS